MTRDDAREGDQIRPLTCELGTLGNADGSATLTCGNSSALVAVFGFRNEMQRKELHDRSTVEVVWKNKEPLDGMMKAHLIDFIVNAVVSIHDAPRASLRIVVQEVQVDGSFLACATNATCLALLNAGVPMKGLFSASSCAFMEDGSLVMDPTAAEEKDAVSVMTATTMHTPHDKENHFLSTYSATPMSREQVRDALEAIASAASFNVTFMRHAMSSKTSSASSTPS